MFSSEKKNLDVDLVDEKFKNVDATLLVVEESITEILNDIKDLQIHEQPKIWSTVFSGTQQHNAKTWIPINGMFCDIVLDEISFAQIHVSISFSGGQGDLNAGFRVVKYENGVKKTFKMPTASGNRLATHFSFQPEKNYDRNLCTVSFSICEVSQKSTTKIEVEMFASDGDTITINRLRRNDNAPYSNYASSCLMVIARKGRQITDTKVGNRQITSFG